MPCGALHVRLHVTASRCPSISEGARSKTPTSGGFRAHFLANAPVVAALWLCTTRISALYRLQFRIYAQQMGVCLDLCAECVDGRSWMKPDYKHTLARTHNLPVVSPPVSGSSQRSASLRGILSLSLSLPLATTRICSRDWCASPSI